MEERRCCHIRSDGQRINLERVKGAQYALAPNHHPQPGTDSRLFNAEFRSRQSDQLVNSAMTARTHDDA